MPEVGPKRIAIKFFTTSPESGADLQPFIPLFHRFIQEASVAGLLLDVADYAHVPNGPGIVLIGHDVDYGIDSVGGRTGLLTVRKRAGDLSLADLLVDTFAKALGAIRAIEADESVKIRFALERVEIQILDRLFAGNDEEGFDIARADVEAVASQAFGKAGVSRAATDDGREPLTLEVVASQAVDAKTLLDRLGGGSAAADSDPPGPAVPGQSDWDLSAEQLEQMRSRGDDFLLLDVREPNEAEICEIGGKLLPLAELGERIGELDPDAHIVVHCHLGGRSAAAVKALRGAGFENVWNLQGGIRAWIQRIDPSLSDY
ncbi:MAG: rhodanese-like domain-containing protein [Myxococcota bacterium]|nr:rhodanese-like domain-containing protein [Myxococcota bacterium]